jgi:hypothetical protein
MGIYGKPMVKLVETPPIFIVFQGIVMDFTGPSGFP